MTKETFIEFLQRKFNKKKPNTFTEYLVKKLNTKINIQETITTKLSSVLTVKNILKVAAVLIPIGVVIIVGTTVITSFTSLINATTTTNTSTTGTTSPIVGLFNPINPLIIFLLGIPIIFIIKNMFKDSGF